jgi:hypothetical protein
VKSLKVSVIAAVIGYIFLMIMETADLSVYHDLGPKHFDSGQLTVVQSSPKKPDYRISHDATNACPFAAPQIYIQICSSIAEEARHTSFTPLAKFPARAPPA